MRGGRRKEVEVFLPDYDDVMEIHWELADLFQEDEDPISPAGPRDENLVHSACMRPHTGIGAQDKYDDEYQKLGALFHSLTQNHAFHNGNKRTALVTLLLSLYRNQRIFDYSVSDDEVYQMTITVANGGFLSVHGRIGPDEAVEKIAKWLRDNTVSRKVAPSDMKVSNFIERCEQLGCQIREYAGGHLISYCENSVRIGSDTRQFPGKVARRYLSILGLTYEQTGQTFAEFQNVDDAEREELYRYMTVLRRLAKV
jgi:prophage maintenance system killer protein